MEKVKFAFEGPAILSHRVFVDKTRKLGLLDNGDFEYFSAEDNSLYIKISSESITGYKAKKKFIFSITTQ